MFMIDAGKATPGFAAMYEAAREHLAANERATELVWLKASLLPPFLEHLSFRIGNQLFFVRIVDVDGVESAPGTMAGLARVAGGCGGHACLMPMKWTPATAWRPAAPGWGLCQAATGAPIVPPSLVTERPIEMTDWELYDFAVQIVRTHVEQEMKRYVASYSPDPEVFPSLWFEGEHSLLWVVIRAVRYPARDAARPGDLPAIRNRFGPGYFASVSVANADDPFESTTAPAPLWRGDGLLVRFTGLVPV